MQGILTGIRGLSNGFGPAVFGLLFYFFHVELDETAIDMNNNDDSDNSTKYNGVSLKFTDLFTLYVDKKHVIIRLEEGYFV